MKFATQKAAQMQFAIALLVGVLIVMSLPILNGGPAIYFDTPAYLQPAAKVGRALFSIDSNVEPVGYTSQQTAAIDSPEGEKVVTSGRSLYYGLFLYLGWETSLWIPVAIQALVLSWLVLILFRMISPQAPHYSALATLFLISIFSSASFFAGLLMPDIWAGIMILTLALLWSSSDRLSTWSKLAMLAVLVFSVLAHSSHFVLLAAITVLFVILHLMKLGFREPAGQRSESLARKIAIPVIALAFGVAGMVAYGFAVKVGYGAKLLHRPFITAHLTDMGPGTRYLQQSCPESGFVLCDFKDRLPVNWQDFLFDRSPETGVFAAASKDMQLAITDEQIAFALKTLAAEPISTISGLMYDGLSQLWTMSMAHVALNQRNEAFLVEHAPPTLIEQVKATRVYTNPDLSLSIERNSQTLAIVSVLILGAWLILHTRRGTEGQSHVATMSNVVTILVAGFVLNALICGFLASPYGRFQARIVWILPLIASLILASKLVALEKPRWLPTLGSS